LLHDRYVILIGHLVHWHDTLLHW